MSQDRANAAPKPLPFLRVVCVALAILLVLGAVLEFRTVARQANLLLAVTSVLFAVVPLSMAFISWPHQTPQLTAAITLGIFAFPVVFVSSFIRALAILFPLLSLPATIIAWLGIAMIVISDLLFVGAFGSTALARLRASA